MKKLFAVLFVLASFATLSAQTVWTFDKAHTTIGFHVTHLVISEVDGKFQSFDGKVVADGENFEGASIEFTADAASVDTDNKDRDNHLKSDDFFAAEKYPKLTFKSKSFEKVGENKYVITGDLTMRGVTKEIKLDAKLNGIVTDPWGATKAGFKVTGSLNRFDYGLAFNSLMETGGAVVGKEVDLNINVELTKN